jgi:hypothetical protein
MKLSFELTEKDQKKLFSFHYSRYRILRFRPYYGTAMILLGGIYLVWKGNDDPLSPICVMFILFGAYFIVSKRFYIRRSLSARPKLSTPFAVELEIQDEGIKWKDPSSEGKFKWSSLIGYRECKVGFLLYSQRNLFSSIPSRALSEEEKQYLSRILAEKLRRL